MKEETMYQLTDQYIEGKLSVEEKAAFDDRLHSDEAFAKQVSEYMVSVYLLKQQAWEEKKKQLAALYKENNQGKSNIRSLPRWIMAAAASLLVLFAGYWLFGRQETTQELFAENKSLTYKKILNENNRSADNQFEQAFEQQNFNKALEISKTEFQHSDALLQPIWLERQGFCHWEMKNHQLALATFNQLKAIKEIPTANNPALWYEAITYLAIDKKQNAKAALNELMSNQNHLFYKEANTLIKQL